LEYVTSGGTIILEVEFKALDGSLVDPNDITLTIRNVIKEVIDTIELDETNKISEGVYHYNYIVPDDTKGELVCEFKGTYNDSTLVVRKVIEPVDIVPNYKPTSLYGN